MLFTKGFLFKLLTQLSLDLLEAEGRGFVEDGYRTKKDVIDVDFGVKGPHPYDLADVKTPINWGKGNEDLKAAAERMGKKITQLKITNEELWENASTYCGFKKTEH